MAAFDFSLRLHCAGGVALAAALCCAAHAQQADNTVIITGRTALGASVAGFGDTPLTRTPLQASVIGSAQLADAGVASIAGLTRLDASASDAYNAEGYWSNLSVRGYTLDNRFNYRRDGLPINAETAIALDNKERIELFKGTSGIQAGTSAPGGLVNLVVKRPDGKGGSTRQVTLAARQHGSLLVAADLGEQFGNLGLRLNAAIEKLDPPNRNTRGQRSMFALAADFQLTPHTLVQAEVESSHQRQPSVAGFSMQADSVPAAASIDPRINLNDQPWRQPVVLNGTTASLRLQQRLPQGWTLLAHAMQQRLKSDDRTAFPYGADHAGLYDRYASDGTFTYWEYVSNNERRTSNALQLVVNGQLQTANVRHRIETGVLLSRQRGRFEDQIFDIAGIGNIDGSLSTQPSLGSKDANTNRDDRSTEIFVRDAMVLGDSWQLWAGLRHTQLERQAQRTSPASATSDGLRATGYERSANTPWLALAYQLTPHTLLYGSWGKGLETDVAPNRSRYTNAGQSLALGSRQVELGIKHGSDRVEAALTVFDIDRGHTTHFGNCDAPDTCTLVVDGSARHRGIEAQGTLNFAQWSFNASAMLLDAQRQGSARVDVNGQRPVNVPARTLRVNADYRVPALPGLVLQAGVAAESNRVVVPDDKNARIPGWTRVDLGARWKQGLGSSTLLWRVGVDNAANRRAWKESPHQFGHVYLYPLAPRTWRASVQASF